MCGRCWLRHRAALFPGVFSARRVTWPVITHLLSAGGLKPSNACAAAPPDYRRLQRNNPNTVAEYSAFTTITGRFVQFVWSGPSRATAGMGETFSRGSLVRKFLNFLKWRSLVYLIFLSDDGAPNLLSYLPVDVPAFDGSVGTIRTLGEQRSGARVNATSAVLRVTSCSQ